MMRQRIRGTWFILAIVLAISVSPAYAQPARRGAGGRAARPPLPGVLTHVPSESAGDAGIAVRVLAPPLPRYADGAPVAIWVAGGHGPGNAGHRPTLTDCGFVEVAFAFPGGGEGPARSGGQYDFRGPNCAAALRDAILFCIGKKRDAEGRTIRDLAGAIPVLTGDCGVIGMSHGGNACGAAMALYGEAFPELAYYVSFESPYGEGNVGVELGGKHLGRVNPAYDPETGDLDLSKLAFDPALTVRGFGERPSQTPGGLFFDMNGDGRFTPDVDFESGLTGPDFDGKGPRIWYSVRLLREAERRKLWGETRPAHIPSSEETAEFWRYRDAAPLIPEIVRKIPNLAVIVHANTTDHVQLAPDHPHILAQVNGFQEAGARFIRLNPDRTYAESLLGEPNARFADNDAGRAYTRADIREALEPDGAPPEFFEAAAACELADRVHEKRFDANLDTVLSSAAPGVEARSLREVTVDAGKVTGKIRSFQGVNCGPIATLRKAADVTGQYKALRIDSVRTHDLYGTMDVDAWRPDLPWDRILFPKPDADPALPESYVFAPSDAFVAAIRNAGAEVYFRLGRSWGAVADPPEDPAKFAEICKRIAMHYNAGWAGGHEYGIRYWEVWNEPNGRMFWTGTPEQFYELYAAVARSLKSFDASLKVGACGLAGGDREGPYREGFLRYCAEHDLPLDFYSWHHYHFHVEDPYDMPRIAKTIRALLDENGFKQAESHITEWNLDLGRNGPKNQTSAHGAAFTAAALIYLQDAPVDKAHYYRGDAGHVMGLFQPDGSCTKKAHAFEATAMMLDTPERIAVDGGDACGFAVLAGRNAEGTRVNVLLCNYEMPRTPPKPERRPPGLPPGLEPRASVRYENNGGYALRIAGLPWDAAAEFTVERRRLSDKNDFTVVEESSATGNAFALERRLPPPGFEIVRLSRKE